MGDKNIILLHGWGANTKKLTPLGVELEKLGWKVFIPELPGFDRDNPENPWTLVEYSHYVSNVASKKFKSKNYVVFGHSFGGRIAVKLGLSNNKQVSGLVLCAIGGISRTSSVNRYMFMTIAKVGKILLLIKPIARIWKKALYKLSGEHDYEKTSGVMKKTFQNVVNEDLKPQVSQLKLPTLILWGNEDRMVPVKDATFLNNKIDNSEIVLYPSQGHKLPYDMPKDVANAINTWNQQFN